MPEVSVVISTFDRVRFLEQAVWSALGQRDVDHEVIVVDNGSTDETAALLAGIDDHRLRVHRNDVSLGSVGGRNSGLAIARGAWVGCLDDDDLWAPGKLAEQLASARRARATWVYTGCVHIDGHGRVLSGRPPAPPATVMAELPTRFLVPGGMSNVLWQREALDGGGLLDPELPFPADWDICLRLARSGDPAGVRAPLVGYRQHGANMSANSAQYQEQLQRLEAKHLPRDGHATIDWGAQARFVASEELRGGSRRNALAAYGRALRQGDLASVPRAAAALLPQPLQAWLHVNALSDREWVRAGEAWLRDVPGARHEPAP
jgi:hypothetical protein